jgi:hypothetical protein
MSDQINLIWSKKQYESLKIKQRNRRPIDSRTKPDHSYQPARELIDHPNTNPITLEYQWSTQKSDGHQSFSRISHQIFPVIAQQSLLKRNLRTKSSPNQYDHVW